MSEQHFLLGFGERLAERVAPPGGGGGSEEPYELLESLTRLAPMLDLASAQLDSLPTLACPKDEAVLEVTLHPQWIAKSYHPQALMNQFHLRQVGSRPVSVEPEKWTRKDAPRPTPATELYLAGKRSDIRDLVAAVDAQSQLINEQIRRIESIAAPDPQARLRGGQIIADANLLEVVLHASGLRDDGYIVSAFEAYAEALGFEAELERRRHVGGLCFIPVWSHGTDPSELAAFSFLRVARPMPTLRHPVDFTRSTPAPGLPICTLPSTGPTDSSFRIAVLDGGVVAGTQLDRWVTSYEFSDLGAANPAAMEHGHDVSSAALFGSLRPGEAAPQPYAAIDHYRVMDVDTGTHDPFELYDVLARVEQILQGGQYEFINLSLGPALPVEDDEVHLWTALLDQYLANGKTILTIAAGNNGDSTNPDEARIQVPADAVNAMSIGAATLGPVGWARATYSAQGPGRSPGRIKPDVLTFGGDSASPFYVYCPSIGDSVALQAGTSFAAPAVLRLAAGVRAHMGSRIAPLGIKALLIHNATDGGFERREVGWGHVSTSVSDLITCLDSEVSILFQGELFPGQYLRAPIPLPARQLGGNVTLKATFCYACPVDPQDPSNYTRSGLDITFRPHSARFKSSTATVADSKSFFKRTDFDNEHTLRGDAQKWETVLSTSKTMRGSSLSQPVFDIHYNARESGGLPREAEPIPYSLVITVKNQRTPALYDEVVRAYSGILVPLTPVISIPVRV